MYHFLTEHGKIKTALAVLHRLVIQRKGIQTAGWLIRWKKPHSRRLLYMEDEGFIQNTFPQFTPSGQGET